MGTVSLETGIGTYNFGTKKKGMVTYLMLTVPTSPFWVELGKLGGRGGRGEYFPMAARIPQYLSPRSPASLHQFGWGEGEHFSLKEIYIYIYIASVDNF